MSKIALATKSLEGFQQVQNQIYSEAKEILRAETTTKTSEEFYETKLKSIAAETKNVKNSAKDCAQEISEKLIPKTKISQQLFKEFVGKLDAFTDFFRFIEQFHSGISHRFENNAKKHASLEQSYTGIMDEFQKLKVWKQNHEKQLAELTERRDAGLTSVIAYFGLILIFVF